MRELNYKDIDKVLRVFESCNNTEQYLTAFNWYGNIKDRFPECAKLSVRNAIQRIIKSKEREQVGGDQTH